MNQKLKFILMFIVGFVLLSILYNLNMNQFAERLNSQSEEAEGVGQVLKRDPKYDLLITSDAPFIVYQTKVNDDAVPDVYQVWYNPMTEEYSYFILEGV